MYVYFCRIRSCNMLQCCDVFVHHIVLLMALISGRTRMLFNHQIWRSYVWTQPNYIVCLILVTHKHILILVI